MFSLFDAGILAPALRSVASEAAEMIRMMRGQNDSVYRKSDGTPVTDADLETDRLLLDRLLAIAPGVPYFSEESPYNAERDGEEPPLYWLTDPIDATADYVRGGDSFTVNIALILNGEAVMGAVACPMRYSIYYTDVEGGARKYDERTGGVTPLHALPDEAGGLRALISRSRPDEASRLFLERFYAGAEVEYRAVPGSLKLALLAEGAAHCYPRLSNTARSWDIAAGHAVLKAAGGQVLTHGGELRYRLNAPVNPPFFALAAGGRNAISVKNMHRCFDMEL